MVQVCYTTRCWSLRDKHNFGPATLGCVYPVETSTSLYNLYLEHGVIKYCNVIGQCLDSKSHRILSGYLESSLLT